ncbi:MAG TPA: ankyrin repeat domain-containing protein, partial [Nodosilinea sp.]|nr:ankyrin repeat domain-containing protein [Nodosilinea sp.]
MANSPLPYWQIPLFCAVTDDSADQVALLLGDGADPNLCDDQGYTPLMKVRSTAVASLLLKAGAQVHFCNNINRDAFECILCGEVGFDFPTEAALLEVLHLLAVHGADPNSAQCWDNRTRLYTAAAHAVGDYTTAIIQRLLHLGANPHLGLSPLHGLCSRWNGEFDEDIVDSFNLLVEAGCDLNWRAEDGISLLHLAAAEDWSWGSLGPNYTAVRCLLSHGADPNAVDAQGWTPLMMAVRSYI